MKDIETRPLDGRDNPNDAIYHNGIVANDPCTKRLIKVYRHGYAAIPGWMYCRDCKIMVITS